MHRYYHPAMSRIHPAWLAAPIAIWAILLSVALSVPVAYHEPGVRHALPKPYVPQCYAVEWMSGNYCEFRKDSRVVIDRKKNVA